MAGPIPIADLALLLAAVQGVSITVFILVRYGRTTANRLFAALLFAYSVLISSLFLDDIGAFDGFERLNGVLLGIAFLIPPIFLYYTLYQVHPTRRWKPFDLLNLVPFLLFETSTLLGQSLPAESGTGWFTTVRGVSFFTGAILLWVLPYIVIALVWLRKRRRTGRAWFSNLTRISFGWLRNLAWMTVALILLYYVESMLRLQGVFLSQDYTLTSLFFAIYVYIIGYLSLFRPEIFSPPREAPALEAPSGGVLEADATDADEAGSGDAGTKYRKSGLTPARARAIRDRLLDAMETEQLYTRPDLTLVELADHLEISPHSLSEAINTQLEQNFFDLVNRYRLARIQQDLADPKKNHYTVLALAFSAGFGSKSSFNHLFKKHTGKTPSEYRTLAQKEAPTENDS